MSDPLVESSKPSNAVVSICCISYNQEQWIARCLEGMIAQVVDFPIEILIYDDASTDRTQDIIKQYQSRHPHLITATLSETNQFSQGYKPLIELVKSASGKYIALCEADDYWTDPTKLAQQVSWLESNPETVMVGHEVLAVDAQGRQISWFTSRNPFNPSPIERDFDQFALQTLAGVIPTCCRLFRNIPFEIPKEASSTLASDAFLQVVLAEYGSYKYLKDIGPACYTVSDAGVWSSLDSASKLRRNEHLYRQVSLYLKRVGHTKAHKKVKRKASALLLEQKIRRALLALGLLPLAQAIKRRLVAYKV